MRDQEKSEEEIYAIKSKDINIAESIIPENTESDCEKMEGIFSTNS
jgi:hypothetical protein